MLKKVQNRLARHKRIRARLSGTPAVPRLSVYRSNSNIYAQLIDDSTGVTLVSASDLKETTGTKSERAAKVGASIAQAATAKGHIKVVFDRGGFKFFGRVKALAEAARSNGLSF